MARWSEQKRLSRYARSVDDELARLQRAQLAGQVLAPLRVTHCPVCDQTVSNSRGSEDSCYLCCQRYDQLARDGGGTQRIEFELEQLREEQRELRELLEQHASELARLNIGLREVADDIGQLEALLRPTREAAAAILPPDLSVTDQEVGRLDEQLRTLTSIGRALEQRDAISREIDAIGAQVHQLQAEVSSLTHAVDFDQAAVTLSDGFNSYFNALNEADSSRWPEGTIDVQLARRHFGITAGGTTWKRKLGATYACFFLNAYQYALLGISGRSGCHYPGLTILDFPPTLADGQALTDEENYLVEPFVGLVNRLRNVQTQVIVAGRAFVDLDGALCIELSDVLRCPRGWGGLTFVGVFHQRNDRVQRRSELRFNTSGTRCARLATEPDV